MPKTIYDKIWNEHLVHQQNDGTSLLFVDRHLIHEVTSPQAFEGLRNSNRKVRQPKLTLAVADLFNYEGDADTYLATAIEYVHSATLLHDDVIDGSEKRRGKTTANLVWDNKSAVLVGDFLFSRAFQLMVKTNSLPVMKILSNASAIISQGEILQMGVTRNIKTTEEQYMVLQQELVEVE